MVRAMVARNLYQLVLYSFRETINNRMSRPLTRRGAMGHGE
ncbi:hypothetical protein SXCC_02750 [Gluconacetobacter sp. SXCC-1]|nr:hypothetical protein SXCC_02750 [Gluconacetobacter sp. SXCC-1]